MTRWERLEEYLFTHDKQGTSFRASEYADEVGFDDVEEATADIQAYLRSQRRPKSKTLYVLHRMPKTRTSNAKWSVGVRSKDARLIGRALADDTKRRVFRAFMPDLVRLRKLNPRASKLVEAQIGAVIDGAMVILAAAAEGMSPDDE